MNKEEPGRGLTIRNPNGRIIVVGDLHGCVIEAKELLHKANVTPNDRVIFAGDLVDRGPDNEGCVDLAMLYDAILGNHEDKHIQHQDKFLKTGNDLHVTHPSHRTTRSQLRTEHYDYFRSLPHYIRLPEYNAVVVHAGVYPGRSIEEQKVKHLLHVQMLSPNVHGEKSVWASKVTDDTWKFWTHWWDGEETVIFGHSVLDKPLMTDKAVGIDGGAVFGRELWAVVLPTWEIVSVQGKANHGTSER